MDFHALQPTQPAKGVRAINLFIWKAQCLWGVGCLASRLAHPRCVYPVLYQISVFCSRPVTGSGSAFNKWARPSFLTPLLVKFGKYIFWILRSVKVVFCEFGWSVYVQKCCGGCSARSVVPIIKCRTCTLYPYVLVFIYEGWSSCIRHMRLIFMS